MSSVLGLNFSIGKAESAGRRTLLWLGLKSGLGFRELHEQELFLIEFLLKGGHALFLFADLLEDNVHGRLRHPGFAGGVCGWLSLGAVALAASWRLS